MTESCSNCYRIARKAGESVTSCTDSGQLRAIPIQSAGRARPGLGDYGPRCVADPRREAAPGWATPTPTQAEKVGAARAESTGICDTLSPAVSWVLIHRAFCERSFSAACLVLSGMGFDSEAKRKQSGTLDLALCTLGLHFGFLLPVL